MNACTSCTVSCGSNLVSLISLIVVHDVEFLLELVVRMVKREPCGPNASCELNSSIIGSPVV
ncbi:MAG: hypothetical protein ABI551_03835 [Polyangiaceae bacterium]